jgi:chloride channel protein, CIC family
MPFQLAAEIIVTTPLEDLNSILKKLTVKNADSLFVIHDETHGTWDGMLNRRNVIHDSYDHI